MRILSFNKIKWDKNYLIWLGCAFIAAIICGIVLFKISDISIFFIDYADEYVVCIFNFDNGRLIFSHLLKELAYLYAFFSIAYFTRFKFLTAFVLFFRTVICVFYCAVLFGCSGAGGILAAIIIYIPCFLCSVFCCWLLAETCRLADKKVVFFYPAALAVANCVVLILLLNVVFRVFIVII